jgi:hypothetical protein
MCVAVGRTPFNSSGRQRGFHNDPIDRAATEPEAKGVAKLMQQYSNVHSDDEAREQHDDLAKVARQFRFHAAGSMAAEPPKLSDGGHEARRLQQ